MTQACSPRGGAPACTPACIGALQPILGGSCPVRMSARAPAAAPHAVRMGVAAPSAEGRSSHTRASIAPRRRATAPSRPPAAGRDDGPGQPAHHHRLRGHGRHHRRWQQQRGLPGERRCPHDAASVQRRLRQRLWERGVGGGAQLFGGAEPGRPAARGLLEVRADSSQTAACGGGGRRCCCGTLGSDSCWVLLPGKAPKQPPLDLAPPAPASSVSPSSPSPAVVASTTHRDDRVTISPCDVPLLVLVRRAGPAGGLVGSVRILQRQHGAADGRGGDRHPSRRPELRHRPGGLEPP